MSFAPFHAESGRSDVVNTINYFTFTPNSISSFENFTIVDDDVLEFDEIFIAQFSFGPEIANYWNTRQVKPITAFVLIRDDDCKLCSDYSAPNIDLYHVGYKYVQQYCCSCKAGTCRHR